MPSNDKDDDEEDVDSEQDNADLQEQSRWQFDVTEEDFESQIDNEEGLDIKREHADGTTQELCDDQEWQFDVTEEDFESQIDCEEEQLDVKSEHMAGTTQEICDSQEGVDVSWESAVHDPAMDDDDEDGDVDNAGGSTVDDQDKVYAKRDVYQTQHASSLQVGT